MQQAITWTNADQVLYCHMSSLSHNELPPLPMNSSLSANQSPMKWICPWDDLGFLLRWMDPKPQALTTTKYVCAHDAIILVLVLRAPRGPRMGLTKVFLNACGNKLLNIYRLVDWFNTLRPRQNGHFTDDIFRCIFFHENGCISIIISLNFATKGHINNIQALVHIMACTDQTTSHYLNQWG